MRAVVLSMLVAAFSATEMAQCGLNSTQGRPGQPPSEANRQSHSRLLITKAPARVTMRSIHPSLDFGISAFWLEASKFRRHSRSGIPADPRSQPECRSEAGKRLPRYMGRTAPQTFNLAHRVWLYDSSGNFQGTGHLTETLVLGDRGNTQSGSFKLDFYDSFGNFVSSLPGTVVGERISVN